MKFRILEQLENTPRIGIDSLEKMKPLDFIETMQKIRDDLEGVLNSEIVDFSEKIDGFAIRFGAVDNKIFLEGSYTGMVFNVGDFGKGMPSLNNHAEQRNRVLEFLQTHEKIKEVLLSFQPIKVIGEAIWMGYAKPKGKYVQFVATRYDPKKLGKKLTVVLFDSIPANKKEQIIEALKGINDNEVKFEDSHLDNIHISLSSIIDSYEEALTEFPNYAEILTSRKRLPEKEYLQELINSYKQEVSNKILSVIPKGKFGPDFEGVVVKLPYGKTFKVLSTQFKKAKALYNLERKTWKK